MGMEQEEKADLHKKEIGPRRNFFYFAASMLAAFLLTILIKGPDFTQSQDYVLFLLFFSIGLWITEAIPAFAHPVQP